MSDLYNAAPERLWEKIEFHRDELDIKGIDLREPSPCDQLLEKSPLFSRLIEEVEEEFDYHMSEWQPSWAVAKAKHGIGFENYNRENKTSLRARK